jgi:hypothetical protein
VILTQIAQTPPANLSALDGSVDREPFVALLSEHVEAMLRTQPEIQALLETLRRRAEAWPPSACPWCAVPAVEVTTGKIRYACGWSVGRKQLNALTGRRFSPEEATIRCPRVPEAFVAVILDCVAERRRFFTSFDAHLFASLESDATIAGLLHDVRSRPLGSPEGGAE